MRVVVLSDTHLPDGGNRDLPVRAWRELERADVILHGGDVTGAALLASLRERAPVHAVLGNNDHGIVLAGTLVLDLAVVQVAMIHDSGPRAGREGRMHRRFPHAQLVVFGHSHIPWDAGGLGGQRLLNPGSPTQRRGQPHPTLATVDLDDGRIVATAIVAVD